MTKLHRCPICHAKHDAPKAHRAVRALVQAVTFGTIEVLAALALDGWLSVALWLIATWNAVVLVLLVGGLSILATDVDR